MKPRINIITLAVANLARSLAFYRDGLGLPTDGLADDYEDHVAFQFEGGLSFALYDQAALARDAGENEATNRPARLVLSHYVDGKDEVDALLGQAEAAGGKRVGPAEDHPWGYVGRFKDIDGHLWEVIWNTPTPAV